MLSLVIFAFCLTQVIANFPPAPCQVCSIGCRCVFDDEDCNVVSMECSDCPSPPPAPCQQCPPACECQFSADDECEIVSITCQEVDASAGARKLGEFFCLVPPKCPEVVWWQCQCEVAQIEVACERPECVTPEGAANCECEYSDDDCAITGIKCTEVATNTEYCPEPPRCLNYGSFDSVECEYVDPPGRPAGDYIPGCEIRGGSGSGCPAGPQNYRCGSYDWLPGRPECITPEGMASCECRYSSNDCDIIAKRCRTPVRTENFKCHVKGCDLCNSSSFYCDKCEAGRVSKKGGRKCKKAKKAKKTKRN